MNPFFSIVIPVYNVAPYLRECLDSVLAQTFTKWEAICINDGSTDESAAILDEYCAKDCRFRVVHKANAGVSVARNLALDMASGVYVGFVDGDDIIKEEWLQEAFIATKDAKIDVVRLSLCFWDPVGRVDDYRCLKSHFNGCLNSIPEIFQWGYIDVLFGAFPPLMFIKRNIIEAHKIRYPIGLSMREDVVFNMKLLSYVKTVMQCDYSGYIYRMRPTSACRVSFAVLTIERMMREVVEIYTAQLRIILDSNVYVVCRNMLSKYLYSVLMNWICYGKKGTIRDDQAIGKVFSDLSASVHFSMDSINLFWRLPIWSVIVFKTLLLVRATYCVQNTLHHVYRKVCKI